MPRWLHPYLRIHDESAYDSSRGSIASVTDGEEESAHEDKELKDDRPDRVLDGCDKSADDEEIEMFKEVNLASLSTVHDEPISIGKLLGKVSISSVRVAELGSGLLSWESSAMLLIELLHEFASEDLDADAHREEVHGKDILNDDSHRKDEAPEKLLWDLILIFGNTNDFHFYFFVLLIMNHISPL